MKDFDAIAEVLVMLLRDPRYAMLFILLLLAAISDCRHYKIPNWLTVGGALFALVCSVVTPFSHQLGFGWALGGLGLGFGLMLPMYALGVMGAGDVKLMAMVGAFLGVTHTLQAVLFVFVCGGVAALLYSLWHHSLVRMLTNSAQSVKTMVFATLSGMRPHAQHVEAASVGKLPYGVSIAVGTTVFVVAKQLGLV